MSSTSLGDDFMDQPIPEEENKGEGVLGGLELQNKLASISAPTLYDDPMGRHIMKRIQHQASITENTRKAIKENLNNLKQIFMRKLSSKAGEPREMSKVEAGTAGLLTMELSEQISKLTEAIDRETNGMFNLNKLTKSAMEGSEKAILDKLNSVYNYIDVGSRSLGSLADDISDIANDNIKMIDDLDIGFSEMAEMLKKSNVLGQDSIDTLNTVKAGLNMLNPLSSAYNRDVVSSIGNDLTQSIMDEMKANGINGDDIEELINAMDANGDRQISQYELTRSSQRKNVLDVISKMDAATQMMVKNPVFRSQVIRRQNRQSIFGDDPYAKYNQVGLVQQAMASDVEQANLFNVNFGGEE